LEITPGSFRKRKPMRMASGSDWRKPIISIQYDNPCKAGLIGKFKLNNATTTSHKHNHKQSYQQAGSR
jgi:hypothetical protein